MNIRFLTVIFITALISLAGCNSKKFESRTTGWIYNDPKYGGFQTQENYEQSTPPGMVFIEGGTFTMGRVVDDVPGDWNNAQRRVSVNSFYMDQCEISNRDWKEYVHWLQLVYGNPEITKKALPDTTVWQRALAYNDPIAENYYRHVAYDNYPVVGVSWEQAQIYCLWRTDRVNEKLLADAGIIKLPDFASIRQNADKQAVAKETFSTNKYMLDNSFNPEQGRKPIKDMYDNLRKTNYNDGLLMPKFRLPTEAEWEYAAYGLSGVPGESNYIERRIYPWDGHSLRNTEKKNRGRFMANFARGRGDYMGLSGDLNDGSLITAPVDAFLPNDWGLYNMAGNVNEWVEDVYRTSSNEVVEEINPFRGNRFQKPVMRDTVIDGQTTQVVALDVMGNVIFEDYNDSIFAGKYASSDLRNYNDGDPRTSLFASDWKNSGHLTPDQATAKLYSPSEVDAESMLSSHLTNYDRVYKGGGWRDRPYFLNPSTRRYLSQRKASDDLGFRCAMDRLGPAVTK